MPLLPNKRQGDCRQSEIEIHTVNLLHIRVILTPFPSVTFTDQAKPIAPKSPLSCERGGEAIVFTSKRAAMPTWKYTNARSVKKCTAATHAIFAACTTEETRREFAAATNCRKTTSTEFANANALAAIVLQVTVGGVRRMHSLCQPRECIHPFLTLRWLICVSSQRSTP